MLTIMSCYGMLCYVILRYMQKSSTCPTQNKSVGWCYRDIVLCRVRALGNSPQEAVEAPRFPLVNFHGKMSQDITYFTKVPNITKYNKDTNMSNITKMSQDIQI